MRALKVKHVTIMFKSMNASSSSSLLYKVANIIVLMILSLLRWLQRSGSLWQYLVLVFSLHIYNIYIMNIHPLKWPQSGRWKMLVDYLITLSLWGFAAKNENKTPLFSTSVKIKSPLVFSSLWPVLHGLCGASDSESERQALAGITPTDLDPSYLEVGGGGGLVVVGGGGGVSKLLLLIVPKLPRVLAGLWTQDSLAGHNNII